MRLAAFAVALAMLAAPAAAAELSDLAWLEGDWVEATENRTVREVWIAAPDLLAGLNVASGPGRRTVIERMRVVMRDGAPTFIAELDGQPPTAFPLKSLEGRTAVFENPRHDFPQRVIYQRTAEGLVGRIEGEIDGRPRAMTWTFVARN